MKLKPYRSKVRRLSGAQFQAIELLVAGQTKKAAAEAVGVAAFSVTRWCQQGEFKEALEQRRQEVLQANVERLRSMVSRALDILENALDDANARVRLDAARQVLHAAQQAGVQKPKERRRICGDDFLWTIKEREEMRAMIWEQETQLMAEEVARRADKVVQEQLRQQEAARLAEAQSGQG